MSVRTSQPHKLTVTGPVVSGSDPFTTTFPLTENPISQGNIFLNGALDGRDWNNIQTTPGMAFAAAFDTAPNGDLDPVCCLKRSYVAMAAAQYSEMIVKRNYTSTQPGSGAGSHEVSVFINMSISTGSITGYEFYLSAFGNNSLVIWNGPKQNYTLLASGTFASPVDLSKIRIERSLDLTTIRVLQDDVVKITYSGGAAQTYLNGNPGFGNNPTPPNGTVLNGIGAKQWNCGSMTASGSSKLATLASTMPSGWTQMTGTNLPAGLNLFVSSGGLFSGGASGLATGFCDKFARDARTAGKKFYFIGADHNARTILLQYDDVANQWSQAAATVPWGYSGGGTANHGYEGTTFDSSTGKLWHNPPYDTIMRRWDGGTSWGTVATGTSNPSTTGAMEYFPERNAFILVKNENVNNGSLYSTTAAGVATVLANQTIVGAENTHMMVRYSAVRQIVYFGGGNATNNTWMVNAAGTVTRLDTCPIGWGCGGGGSHHCFVNPANGNLIVYASSGSWYECNPSAGAGSQWTAKAGTVAILSSNTYDGSAYAVVSSPTEYGVVAFVKTYGSGGSPAEMWLWKP